MVDYDGNGTTEMSVPAVQGSAGEVLYYPDAELSIRSSSQFNLKVVGISTASTTAIMYGDYAKVYTPVTATTRAYFSTTTANNLLASVTLNSVAYGYATSTATGTITFTYATSTGTTTLDVQRLTIATTTEVIATYNSITNTTLVESNDHGALYEHIWTGSKVLRFRTKEGEVGWVFGS